MVGDGKFLRLQVQVGGQANGIDEGQFPADQNARFQNGGATVGQDLPTENITPVGIPGKGMGAYDRGVAVRLVLIGLCGIVFGLRGVRVTRGNRVVRRIVEHGDGKLLLQGGIVVVSHFHPYA